MRRRVYLCPKCGKILPICLPPYARYGDSMEKKTEACLKPLVIKGLLELMVMIGGPNER